jgi:hypothetical protein
MSEREEWALESNGPLFQEIQLAFAPVNNDVITIVSASTQEVAEHCAVAAALTLIP